MMNTNRIPNDQFEDELDAIRIQLHEKTKDMTAAERVDYINRRAREVIKEHGLNVKIADSATDAPTSQP